jgi:hypothetical protein
MERRSFPRAFERREKIYLIRGLFMRNLRDVNRPCKRAALYIGALLGNLEGVHLLGLFERKIKCISGFLFFWTQRTLRV